MSVEEFPHPAAEQPTAMRRRLLGAHAGSLGLRLVRAVGFALIGLGTFLLGFVAHQLWVTDVLAEREQGGLEADLASRTDLGADVVVYDPVTGEVGEAVGSVPADVIRSGDPEALAEALPGVGDPSTTPENVTIAPTDRFLLRDPTPALSDAVGAIRIPEVGMHWTVVEGVTLRQLRKGAGHMPNTPLPGQPGNAVISGHRTTHGAPFSDLDELAVGDLIYWDSPSGTHVFSVREAPLIVRPTDIWVTNPREGAWITLTTCHPKFSASQRLIIFAELVDGPNFPVLYGGA